MKPPTFDYVPARDLGEAVDALAGADGMAKVLAGGQSLIPLLNMRLAAPRRLVDINRLAELNTVEVSSGGVRVGALARHARVERAPGVAGTDGTMSPVQRAFQECHGLQCGFCTPGFLCTVTALLRDNPEPTHDEVIEGISGNLCRCTGYQNIVGSVRRAAELIEAERAGDTSGTRYRDARHQGRRGGRGDPGGGDATVV